MDLVTKVLKPQLKKNVPEICPGDTVRISFKITEGAKKRIQIFEGICISAKHGRGINGSFTLRKIASGIGVERTFPLHSPLITKFEKINKIKVRRAKLYFLRELLGKKGRRKGGEMKEYQMWEEALSEEEMGKIEEEQKKAAEKKQAEKAEKEKELAEKFDKAVSSHKEEEK